MKFSHISITARGAKSLAKFYVDALGLCERRPPIRLRGEVISRGNGFSGLDICSIWLDFPGGSKPFLEIMQYSDTFEGGAKRINAPGFAHIALEVSGLDAVVEQILRCGGTLQGEIVNLGSQERPLLCVYVRDPEGNVLELEQPRQ